MHELPVCHLREDDDFPQEPIWRANISSSAGIITRMSFSEMAILFLLGLIMFGPKRLPELSRQLGRILGELRRASQDFQSQLHDEVRKLDSENDIGNTINSVQVTGTTARERLLNVVMDAGKTIKSTFDDKPEQPKELEANNSPTATQESVPAPSLPEATATLPTVVTEDSKKETVH
jgi:Sec-independent protein translocase protein TatA